MHRYSTASGGSGIGGNTGGGREASRTESTFANFATASTRRGTQLTSYKLKCDKEILSPRLGPPDYYPPAPNCAEELLSRESAQHGYREVIDGIEEGKETSISFIGNVLLTKDNVSRYKEALRKRLRSVTNALNRKRKAGQVYDVPLGGHLLAKPGCFPERHACSEDYRRKWLEDLSQRKRLATLAEHVPHGIYKKTLFEALIKQNVPFLRATWLIKVVYLNQARPASAANSASNDKSQAKRFEQWTKDLLDYAQTVLEEFPPNGPGDSSDPDAQTKWNYLVRLVQWQYTEGLLQPSHIVDWALRQIQEKDLEKFERVLPLLLESMDLLSLSQVHVRAVVYICLDWLRQLPQQHHLVVTLVEVVRYLLAAVPDTFVAFDCFPLPSSVFTLDGSGSFKAGDITAKNSIGQATGSPYREFYVTEVVEAIQKRAASLIKAVNPGILRTNEGKLIQGLDKSLVTGDVYSAYSLVFDSDISGQEQLPGEWKEFSTCSPFLSSILNSINLSDLYSVRFICEWAVCDFRDTRQKPSRSEKLLGVKDMSRVYMAVSVLCIKKAELESTAGSRNNKKLKNNKVVKVKPKGKARGPGPLHDIIVAWIDQHDVRKGEGMTKMHLLLSELVRQGIFHPEAYVRQLIVEGTLEKKETQADITRASRHRSILRFLPGPELEESKEADGVPESVRLYRNERRLALHGFYQAKVGPKVPLPNAQDNKKANTVVTLAEVKQAVSAYLQIPEAGGQQKGNLPAGTKRNIADATPGCEECLKNKRQKTGERTSGILTLTEPEDTWWLKKVPKAADPIKLEPSVKPPKQSVRGRPKTVRKTQSLAQLHSARIDGSQGASSSHTCDNRSQCPHHRPGSKVQLNDAKTALRDLRAIGSAIKQLRFPEKCAFSTWMNKTVRDLISGNLSEQKWHLTEERFGIIVYLFDTALDFHSLLKLLLRLLPGRTGFNKDVGEATILACLRRYEGALTSMNLLPEVLSTVMQCASTTMGSFPTGRATCSLLLWYVRELSRKYGTLQTVQSWEKGWRASCDQKLALEFEALKSGESDSLMFDDRDDPIPQRLNSRLAKTIGMTIKDTVQKGMGEVVQILTRERDAANSIRDAGNRTDDYVHRVVAGLLDAIKQNGNALQADSALINAAVSALVGNACTSAANACDMLTSSGGPENPTHRCARRILHAHVKCLRLLKEAMDDRQSRALEVSLATEASSIVGTVFMQTSGRAPRSQFHLSPETPEMGVLGDYGAGLNTVTSGKVAAVTSFVILAVTQGVVTLERILAVLRIKDGLEALHLPKLHFPGTNGLSRGAMGSNSKSESMAEAQIHWFRALVGDCRAVCNGLVADMLGDANVVALSRAQRLLPLNSIFTMAYAMFCGLLRRQVLAHMHITSKDGVVQSLSAAVKDFVAHEPFRELCLQDTKALYILFSSDTGTDYAEMLDTQGLEHRSKLEALVPFSSRLFLHALLDKKLPLAMQWPDDEAWMDGRSGLDQSHQQVEQIVHILDEIQPATFHWQWLELRLLLNEQVFMDKLEVHTTAVKALQAVWNPETMQNLSECEKCFTEIVLTRLLGRPDAAPLYSEVLSCFGTCKSADGKPLEEYLIRLVKWVLKGGDVLLGRKSLRQLLETYAHTKNFSIGTSSLKSWQWQPPGNPEAGSLEEGEVQVSEGASCWKVASSSPKEEPGTWICQQYATEKGLADLVLPCLARSPYETCSSFTAELVAQMTELEGSLLGKSSTRLPNAVTVSEGPVTKTQGTRRGARSGLESGSPGVRRRPTGQAEQASSLPISVTALQSSLWLRLQFLLPLLRIVHADRDPGRNLRITLAPVLLRLLGTRIVQESHYQQRNAANNGQWSGEISSVAAGEDLFDRLLSVLHALLSSTWAVWLKPRPTSKAAKPPREVPPFDRDTAERMQTELDHMQLPRSIRMRLQAAMPMFPPSTSCTLAAGPPQVPLSSFNSLQSSFVQQRLSDNKQAGTGSKPGPPLLPAVSTMDFSVELDPWTLLEDGTGTAAANTGLSSSTSDSTALKACPWLKGAVRVRRSGLTYVGSVDSDT